MTEELRALDAEIATRLMGWTLNWSGTAVIGDKNDVWPNGTARWYPAKADGVTRIGGPLWLNAQGPLPRFTKSHDAVAYAEEEIARRGLGLTYARTLLNLTLGVGWQAFTSGEDDAMWRVIRATPEQRCKAALAAVATQSSIPSETP